MGNYLFDRKITYQNFQYKGKTLKECALLRLLTTQTSYELKELCKRQDIIDILSNLNIFNEINSLINLNPYEKYENIKSVFHINQSSSNEAKKYKLIELMGFGWELNKISNFIKYNNPIDFFVVKIDFNWKKAWNAFDRMISSSDIFPIFNASDNNDLITQSVSLNTPISIGKITKKYLASVPNFKIDLLHIDYDVFNILYIDNIDALYEIKLRGNDIIYSAKLIIEPVIVDEANRNEQGELCFNLFDKLEQLLPLNSLLHTNVYIEVITTPLCEIELSFYGVLFIKQSLRWCFSMSSYDFCKNNKKYKISGGILNLTKKNNII